MFAISHHFALCLCHSPFAFPKKNLAAKQICRSCRFKCVEVILSTSINNVKADSQGNNGTLPDQVRLICTDKQLSDSCTVVSSFINHINHINNQWLVSSSIININSH